MRFKKALFNSVCNVLFFLISSFFMFFSRSFFIEYLGSEIAGLDGLFKSIIGFLNLAELGLSNVVVYSLYKPLSNNNTKRINEIMQLYRLLYRIIGFIIILLGLVLSFKLDLLASYMINKSLVQNYFILYLFNVSLSYFFTYKYVIAIADQNAYIITIIEGTIKIFKSIIQIVTLVLYKNYLSWLIIEIISNSIGYIICNYKIKRIYNKYNLEKCYSGSIKTLIKENLEIIKNIKNMFIHKVGSFIVFQTDTILISKYISLTGVTIYTNYNLVLSLASNIVGQIFNGIGSSIGNLIAAEKSNEEAYELWKMLQSFNFFLAIVFIVCIYYRIEDFIRLWVGEFYLLDKTSLVLLLINLYFLILRGSIGKFKDAYGIFWDRYIPLTEASINLFISWYLVKIIGINGVIIGTIVSNIFVMIFWTPYIVFKVGFKHKVIEYHLKNFKLLILALIPIFITSLINNFAETFFFNNGILCFIILLLINFISISVIYSLFLLNEHGFKMLIRKLFNITKVIIYDKRIYKSNKN